MTVHFPHLPNLWLLVAASVLLAAIAILSYRGTRDRISPRARRLLSTARFAALVLLVLCLCDPIFPQFQARKAMGVVALLVDTSGSMRLPVAEAQKTDVSRIALAQEMTTGGLTERLKRDFRVKTYAFGEDLREQAETAGPLEATGKRTNVARALSQLSTGLANETVSAVFLLTDGGDNGVDDPLAAAAA
ncbi:MAG: hypothetical protein FJ278_13745, partial [Planctomycetes bacterium]|nr:hypothetical protein [Planctomycetota bacterium]